MAFYAIGAYVVGILTTRTRSVFWLALPLGGVDCRRRRRAPRRPGAARARPLSRHGDDRLRLHRRAGRGRARLALPAAGTGSSAFPPRAIAGRKFAEREIAISDRRADRAVDSGFAPAQRPARGARPCARCAMPKPASAIDRPRPDRDPHRGLRHLGGRGRRHCRRRVRVHERLHQPGVVSVLPVDPVPAGGHDRRRRPCAGPADRRAASWCCCPSCCRRSAQYRLLFVGPAAARRAAVSRPMGSSASSRRCSRPKAGEAVAPSNARDIASFLAAQRDRQRHFGRAISRSASAACSAVRDLSLRRRARAQSPASSAPTARARARCSTSSAASTGPTRLDQARRRESRGCRSHRSPRAGIARTYQTTQLFGTMRVIDNILVALRRGRLGARAAERPSAIQRGRRARREPARLRRLRRHARPAGGRAVRTSTSAWSRSPARSPSAPPCWRSTSRPPGSTPRTRRRLGELLRKVAAIGIAVLLVEHDMKLVMGVSDHVVVLDAGAEDRRRARRRGRGRNPPCARPIWARRCTPRASAQAPGAASAARCWPCAA